MEDKTLITTAPPPPSEVKIRTMQSDIASMMQSGGGAPSYQTVSVQGLSLEKSFKAPTNFVTAPVAPAVQSPAGEPVMDSASGAGSGSSFIPKLIVGLVALIAIAVVGYFAYTIFSK